MNKNFIEQYRGLPRDIYILFIARIVNKLGMFVYPFLTFLMTQKLGYSKEYTGFIMLIASSTYLIGAPIGGKLTDSFGRKKILVLFQSAAAFSFILCGFIGITDKIPHILIVANLFNSIAGPASSAMVADLTTQENRKQSFSLLYLGTNVGAAIGPGIAGLLFENHARWLFLGDGITTLLSLTLVFLYVKESKPKDFTNVTDVHSENEQFEEGSVFSAVLKKPALIAFVIIASFTSFIYSQHSFSLPVQLGEVFDNGADIFGKLMMLNGFVVLLLTAPLTSLTHNLKPVVNMAIASFTYAIGFGMLYYTHSVPMFVISTIIWTVGEILVVTNSGVYIANHSPVNQRGRFSSIFSIVSGIGFAIGPKLMGRYIDINGIKPVWPLLFVISICVVIGFTTLNILETNKTIKNK